MGDLNQCIQLTCHIILQILCQCIRVILRSGILIHYFVVFEVFDQFNNILCIHAYFSFGSRLNVAFGSSTYITRLRKRSQLVYPLALFLIHLIILFRFSMIALFTFLLQTTTWPLSASTLYSAPTIVNELMISCFQLIRLLENLIISSMFVSMKLRIRISRFTFALSIVDFE